MTGATTAKGLGWPHQQDKARLLRELTDGTPCPLPEYCGGQPMHHPARCTLPPDGNDGRCFYCRLERDHLLPRALGGVDGPARLTHAWCNRKRGAALRTQLRTQPAPDPHPARRPW